MRAAKAFRHLVNHIVRLGPFTGLRVLWLKQRGPGHEAVIRVHDLAGPLIVRTGSSDLAIFDEVVMLRGYGFTLNKPPRVILDIGANIGMATLTFKRRYPDARVVAVEPDPENFDLLRRNTASLKGVELLQAALTPMDGMIGFERDGLNPSGFHIRDLKTGEQGVPAISMRTLMERFGLERVDLLKLDIEGAEKELFEAADLAWMDRVDTIAVELHDRMRPGCGHAFFKASSRSPRNYDVHEYLVIASKA
ncbi:MAG: FkbM family methyltransferase [Flavobacteriales bacterium]